MFNRRRRNGKIIVGCFVLLLSGFLYGFFTNEGQVQKDITNNDKAKTPSIAMETENNDNEDETSSIKDNEIDEEYDVSPVVQNDNLITNNTKIIFRTYYEKTRDTVEQVADIPVMMVGVTLDEFKSYLEKNYSGWSIREINKDVVELYQVANQISPEHYVIKEYNGYISIFHVDEEGNTELIDQTEIPISSLSSIDQQKMKEGIVVKGEDGINQILEDYSS